MPSELPKSPAFRRAAVSLLYPYKNTEIGDSITAHNTNTHALNNSLQRCIPTKDCFVWGKARSVTRPSRIFRPSQRVHYKTLKFHDVLCVRRRAQILFCDYSTASSGKWFFFNCQHEFKSLISLISCIRVKKLASPS